MAYGVGQDTVCIWMFTHHERNSAGACGRWVWAQAGIRMTVRKVYMMPFLFAGGISIWWSNRNNSVRFGEETWCSLVLQTGPAAVDWSWGQDRDSLFQCPFLWEWHLCSMIKSTFPWSVLQWYLLHTPLEEVSSLLFRLMLLPGMERTVEIHCWE